MKTNHTSIGHRMTGLAAGIAVMFFSTAASSGFAGGNGSLTEPFQVAIANHLDAVRNHLGAHFVQTAEIDLGVAPWNSGAGWVPIGSSGGATRFTGTYDGGGHAILNLRVNRPGTSYQGLFGYTQNATILRLWLADVDVKGSSYTGALAGQADGTTIAHIRVDGTINGTVRVGGLSGFVNGGAVFAAAVDAAVSGTSEVGGLVGYTGNAALTVIACRSAGSVSGTDRVGGFVGNVAAGWIVDGYSRAAVAATGDAGGFAGYLGGGSSHLLRVFSTGAVNGTGAHTGGLLGFYAGGTVTDASWDRQTSGRMWSARGTGRPTAEMRQQASFANFNFQTLWRIDEGNGYPEFRELSGHASPQAVDLADLAGDGSAVNPYLVTNADELNAMRQDLAAHYRLGNDINLSATVSWDAGRGWTPVGAAAAGQRFTGSLDGSGHAILNLTINRPAADYQGLFGYTESAAVRRLELVDAHVTGRHYTGMLAGNADGSAIEQVRATGMVRGTGNNTGGLLGRMQGGGLLACGVDGTVRGLLYTGGLVGETLWVSTHGAPTIRYSHTLGTVSGTDGVGGLVGRFLTSTDLADAYSRAAVSGVNSVGGLAGHMTAGGGGLRRGYSVGAVSGTGSDIGGLIGLHSSGSVAQSYWDSDTSGQAQSGGGTGQSTAAMQQRATFTGFDFQTAWRIDEGHDYPVFRDLSRHAGPQAVNLVDLDGTGSAGDPYIITSASELNAMRQNLAAHYRLGNEIDLSVTVVWDLGRGWTPVGGSATGQRFTGSLDGNGHTLRNLSVNRNAADHQALFGFTENATIRRLSLHQLAVHGRDQTGGLAGRTAETVVTGVDVTGTVTGRNFTGGLLGDVDRGHLRGVSATAEVRGGQHVGGLAGRLSSPWAGGSGTTPTLYHAWSAGTVAGELYVGGLVGHHGSGIITDTYSLADVTGGNEVGGLVGTMDWGVFRSFSAGAVSGTGTLVGGFVGNWRDSYGSARWRHCFWDSETSGQSTSAAGIGLDTAAMRQAASYAFFDFNTLWTMEEGHGYPRLQDSDAHAGPQAVTLGDLDGTGAAGDPYVITTADELNAMRLGLDKHYQLGNDIDLSGTVVWDHGRGWVPVGTAATGQRFTGSLDGAGYSIRNLSINRPRNDHQGLFAYIHDGLIRNLRIEAANVQAAGSTGALAGQVLGGHEITVVEDVVMSGQVSSGLGSYVGGLVGLAGGQMFRVAAVGRVAGTNGVGGLAGYTGNRILQAYSLGSVEGASQVGGLVGYMSHGNASLADSYSRAAVSGIDRVGGLVGDAAFSGRVDRCYSSGFTDGTGTHLGGLLGRNDGVTVAGSYWDTESSGRSTSAGGIGKVTAEMWQMTTYPWNFSVIWDIEENAGYPFHRNTSGVLAIHPAGRHHRATAVVGQTIEVTASAAWTATAEDAWIEVTGSTSGGMVIYNLQAHTGTGPRTGTITVSNGNGHERSFTVTQEALLTVSPGTRWHDATASAGHEVTVSGNVDWTAHGTDSWIVVTGGASGLGDGMVTYRVEENPGRAPRSGSLVVSGGGVSRAVTIDQAASPAYLVVTPSVREHTGDATTGHTVAVIANVDWTATAADAWIVVTGGAVGSGDGTVTYNVAANPTGTARHGAIVVSGNPGGIIRVDQASAAMIHVSAAPEAGGVVGGGALYGVGDPVSVTAVPNSGYSFHRWSEGGATVSTAATYHFTAAVNRALVAHFCVGDGEYLIAVAADPPAGGVVGGGGMHRQCSNVTVSATANSGYSFSHWSEGGTEVSSDAAYGFSANSNRHLIAHFCVGQADFDIAVEASSPAAGTVAGGGSYRQCSRVTITAAPAYRHHFVGWFDGETLVSEDAEYHFTADAHRSLTGVFDFDFAAGTGTVADPFRVATAAQLDRVRGDLNAHFLQVADIDLGTAPWNPGTGWVPLGLSSDGYRFTGSYDGGGHVIANLTIDRSVAQYQALFGYLQGATLRNLRLDGVQVRGGSYAGALAGFINNSTLDDLWISGTVQGAGYTGALAGYALNSTTAGARFTGTVQGSNDTGGLIGYLGNGSLHSAAAAATVSGASRVGGLVGYAFGSATIQSACTYGSVTGTGSQIGGLVGYHHNTPAIDNTFSRAAVSGLDQVGGLVGYASGHIQRSYSTGTVAGTGANVGGFLGQAAGGTRTHNYWDTGTSGWDTSAGGTGVIGRDTTEMIHPHAVNTYVDWDFETLWTADSEGRNGGYPYLAGLTQSYLIVVGPQPLKGGVVSGAGMVPGASWVTLEAVPDAGCQFGEWREEGVAISTEPVLTFIATADRTLTAHFRSLGGVDIDWYAGHGITPGDGRTWADLDGIDWLGKGMTLLQEFIAGTDPNDPLSRFAAESPRRVGDTYEVHFQPSLPERIYTLWRGTDMMEWNPVAGQIGIAGGNGPLVDPNPAPGRGFYRVEVGPP